MVLHFTSEVAKWSLLAKVVKQAVREQVQVLKLRHREEGLSASRSRLKAQSEPDQGPNVILFKVFLPGGKKIQRRYSSDQIAQQLFDWVDVTMTDRRNMDFIDGYELQSTTHPRRLLAPTTHEDARFEVSEVVSLLATATINSSLAL